MPAVSRHFASAISEERAQLALYDVEANQQHDPTSSPERLGSRSSRARWWRCPVAEDHRWVASPASVSNSLAKGFTGCPACAGRQLSVTNSFAARHPHGVHLWDQNANGDLEPDDVVGGSPRPVWWRCPAGPDHAWQCSPLVMSRTDFASGATGCPFCAGMRASVTNSVATHPTLAAEWHPEKNTDDPRNVVASTGRKLWWRCTKNPAHEWQATGANRTRNRGCPHCKRSLRSILEVCLEFELRDFFPTLDLDADKVITQAGITHVDLLIADEDLVIEVDGRYHHSAPAQLERDARKTRLIQDVGYRVLRVREEPLPVLNSTDVTHPADAEVKVVTDAVLTQLLALGWGDLDPAAVRAYLERDTTVHHDEAIALLEAQRPGQRIRLPAPVIATVDERWEAALSTLRAYVAREGHAAVPWEHQESRSGTGELHNLGKWVGAQRQCHDRGVLRPERVTQLEQLPGWVWDALEDEWEAGLRALHEFAAREGHIRVPAHHWEPDGYPLGSWVRSHRRAGGRRTITEDQRSRLEAVPGWTYDSPVTSFWERAYAAFTAHVHATGTCATARRQRVDGIYVDAWSKQQRAKYLAGDLGPGRARRLEQVPGWSWRPNEDAWEVGFAALRAHLEAGGDTDGHSDQGGGHTTPDQAGRYPVQAWVSEQRVRAKKGTMDPVRRQRLDDLPGWVWSPHEDSWQRHYDTLIAFVEREGHARVPTDHVENGLPLASWVIRHRQDYKLDRVPADRAELLEALPGWTWNVLDARWEDHYDALRRFQAREGHALVPSTHTEPQPARAAWAGAGSVRLGQWVVAQRAQRKTGDLSPERAVRLNAVPGWVWDTRTYAWERGLAELARFRDQHGHSNVPRSYEQHGYKLGSWLTVQRHKACKGELDTERVGRLGQLGVAVTQRVSAFSDGR